MLVKCPNCNMKVLTKNDNTCPRCNKVVDAEPISTEVDFDRLEKMQDPEYYETNEPEIVKADTAITCFRINSIICFLLSPFYIIMGVMDLIGKSYIPNVPEILFIVSGIFCIVFVVIFEFVIRGLKKLKSWAWTAGVVLAVLSLPEILGIVELVNLLKRDVRKSYNQ